MPFKSLISISLFVLIFPQAFSQTVDTIYSFDAVEFLSIENPDMIIIDGRDSLMHASGHISRSLYIDAYSEDADEMLKKYLDYQSIFIYCTTYRRTDALIAKLIEMDYTGRIICMRDGLRAWKNNGYPLEVKDGK